jgi:rhomboid-related protein 1/2/3
MALRRSSKVGGNKGEEVALEMDRLWKPVFDELDRDHDGRIPLDELKQNLKIGNQHLQDLPHEVVDQIAERADWDKNRYLTYDEFLHMIHARDVAHLHPQIHQLIKYAAVVVVPRNQRQTTVSSYMDHYTCIPPPIFMLLISVMEIAVYIYYCVDMKEFSMTGPVPFASELIYHPRKRYQAWRFVSYALVHAGFLHLFFNVAVQLILGIPLEMVHKNWRVALVYLSGVLAGSLAASISDPKSYLAGASGGVYALIAAHLSNVILNFQEMEFGCFRLLALIVFGTTDFGIAIYDRYVSPRNNRTSYAAHLAGAVAGLLVGNLVLRNLRVRKYEILIGWLSLFVFVLLLGAAVLFNIINSEYFEPFEYDDLSYTSPNA